MVLRLLVDGLILCLAAYFFWASGSFSIKNVRGDLGPAFFPKMMAVCLVILVIVHLYCNLRQYKYGRRNQETLNSTEEVSAGFPSNLPRFLEGLGVPGSTFLWIIVTILYLLLIPVVGFAWTTIIYVLITMMLYGVRRVRTLLFGGVFGVLLIYYLFSKILRVPLP